MGKPSSLVVLGLLCAGTAIAQGYVQYVWHGDSNFFNASFLVTPADLQSGAQLANSSLFLTSLSITNPNGQVYQYSGPGSSSVAGTLNPWSFGLTFLNFGASTELFMSGGEPPVGAMAGLIHEKPFSGTDLWYEPGHWSSATIPEPATGVVLAIGLVFLALRAKPFKGSAANPIR